MLEGAGVRISTLESVSAELSRRAVEVSQHDKKLKKELHQCMQSWTVDIQSAKMQLQSVVQPLANAGHESLTIQIEMGVASSVYRELCSGTSLRRLDLQKTCNSALKRAQSLVASYMPKLFTESRSFKGGGAFKGGGRGGGKGKWQGARRTAPQFGVCWSCGGNHYQRDCPMQGRSQGAEQNLLTNDATRQLNPQNLQNPIQDPAGGQLRPGGSGGPRQG